MLPPTHWFDLEKRHIGVGPYTLEEYQPDRFFRFKRNADYWGVTDHFEAIEWDLQVKDPVAQLTRYKNGAIDYISLRPFQYKEQVLDEGDQLFVPTDADAPQPGRTAPLAWEGFKRLAYNYLGWNLRRTFC